jgi:hypothetical protein
MKLARPAIAFTLALAILPILRAQTPQREAPPPVGTASVTGVVTDQVEGRPIRMAKVELQGTGRELIAITDDAGRFTISRLVAGRYSVVVSKPGYVLTTYGATRPGSSGVPVILADGDHATVAIRLPHGAAIGGTARTPTGDPVVNASVTLFVDGYEANGERGLVSRTFSNSGNGSLRTDARGNYRVYGLRPDTYLVAIRPASPGGGRLLTVTELDWARRLIASPGSVMPTPPMGASATFAPIFYPNVATAAGATPVTVAAGEERLGVDVTVAYVLTATVSGTLLGPDGGVPKVSQMSILDPNAPFGLGAGNGFIRPDAEGHFSAGGLLPGDYVIAARGSSEGDGGSSTPGMSAAMPFLAMEQVHVAGQDISGVTLRLGSGATLSGRVALDGTTAKAPDFAKMTVALLAYQQAGATTMAPAPQPVNPDGTVTLRGIGPGRYRVAVNITGAAPWTAATALLNGADAIDGPLEIGRGDIEGLAITLTDHPTDLSGSLMTRDGKPAPQYFLVVASTDPTQWHPGSRRVRAARPGNNGTFHVTGLPPGEYFLVALTDLEQSRMYSADYLEPLVAQGMKITLADGEKKVQDLRVAGGS